MVLGMVMPDLASMYELDEVYSNLDHDLDAKVAAELKARPGESYAQHSAYDFCGYVWFGAGRFHEQVWVHRRMVDVLSAGDIEELVEDVNDRFGHE